MDCTVPLPSCMGPGPWYWAANLTPRMLVPPKSPSSTCIANMPSQAPWVGRA